MKRSSSTGRLWVFDAEKEGLQAEERRLPAPGAGEILIANEYVTLCRSDLKTFAGARKEKNPTILGHEVSGRIVEMGPGAPEKDERGTPLKLGDRLTWAVFASAPGSAMDERGMPQKASDLFKYGHEQLTAQSAWHGGLATHTLLRRHTPVVRVAESVPVKVAALINCAVATMAGAMRLAGAVSGKRVLVSGGGTLGMFACAMARQAGASEVILADPKPGRLEWGQRFGASWGLEPGQVAALQADVVLETSGVPSAMESGLKALETGGIAVWVGAVFPQPAVPVDAEQVIRRLLTIRGLHNYNREDLVRAAAFVEDHHHQYPMAALVEEEYDLSAVPAAFGCGIKQSPFRVGVKI